jgi:hypothetical protein
MKRLTMMSLGLLLAIGALAIGSAYAACPIGSYPWMDKWGTPTCRSFSTGQDETTHGSLERCPAGSYPWTDPWGTKICKSFDEGGPSYYDTSKGCPMGTYNWVDNWGNKICKAF